MFLNTLIGTFTGNCTAAGHPSVTWTPTVSNAEYAATDVQAPNVVEAHHSDNVILAGGSPDRAPAPGDPFSVTYQIGFTSGGQDHVATAWITGRLEATNCVFTGQELTSG